MELPDLGTLRFDGHGDRVIGTPRPGVSPAALAEAYWHAALPLVLHARGSEVLHASAVLTPRGVVAFCGATGSGKSTLAYGLHRRGHALWADDAVALEVSASAIAARSLPFDVRLRPATAALFGLGPAARRLAGQGRGGAAPLGAVCLIGRARPSGAGIGAAAPSVAYPGILAHAFCFSLADPPRKRLMLERYLSLVARVPVFDLRVADGLDHLPALLDEVERVLGDTGPDES